MLMPLASVTLIGLIAALVAVVAATHRPGMSLLLGAGGAWGGFVAGAFVGIILDVILGTGVYVAVIGHVVAALGACLALARFRWRGAGAPGAA